MTAPVRLCTRCGGSSHLRRVCPVRTMTYARWAEAVYRAFGNGRSFRWIGREMLSKLVRDKRR